MTSWTVSDDVALVWHMLRRGTPPLAVNGNGRTIDAGRLAGRRLTCTLRLKDLETIFEGFSLGFGRRVDCAKMDELVGHPVPGRAAERRVNTSHSLIASADRLREDGRRLLESKKKSSGSSICRGVAGLLYIIRDRRFFAIEMSED
jgi:hypothetical protein